MHPKCIYESAKIGTPARLKALLWGSASCLRGVSSASTSTMLRPAHSAGLHPVRQLFSVFCIVLGFMQLFRGIAPARTRSAIYRLATYLQRGHIEALGSEFFLLIPR